MVTINKEGMAQVKKQREQRKETLSAFISVPFELNDNNQQIILKKYIDAFELSINQMYLYQALGKGMSAWAGSWIIGRILPIPDFVNYFLTAFLYFGVTAYMLERFSMTDFYEQLEEMKIIYNWCLKNNQIEYSENIDNSQKLYSSEIQRLIKLLAPISDLEFMIAWPREITKEEESGTFSKTISVGLNALNSTLSLFAPKESQPLPEQQRLKALKMAVETNNLNVGVYSGFEQALRYFASSSNFKTLLASTVEKPMEMIKQVVPNILLETLHPKRP